MAVFDIFKRLVNQNTAPSERRTGERVRTMLGARVLVVDDSATIRAVLGKMLVQDGYEVLKAADGESAVEMAKTQFPDLIFLDIVLPGMSGFAVLRALRRETSTRITPIVMMSGNQQATEQFYVQRFGADGFIKKPFGRAEVFHAVRSLVLAGRMPARVEGPAVQPIPEGMTAEEWEAIPDVAMPDEAHVYIPASDSSGAMPDTSAAPSEVHMTADISVAQPPRVDAHDVAPAVALGSSSPAARSMAMRPTVTAGLTAIAGLPMPSLVTRTRAAASEDGGAQSESAPPAEDDASA